VRVCRRLNIASSRADLLGRFKVRFQNTFGICDREGEERKWRKRRGRKTRRETDDPSLFRLFWVCPFAGSRRGWTWKSGFRGFPEIRTEAQEEG